MLILTDYIEKSECRNSFSALRKLLFFIIVLLDKIGIDKTVYMYSLPK